MHKRLLFLSPILLLGKVSAHCPLCTIGAGAAAAGATWLGVSKIVIGLFIGAFAMSMGMWFSKLVKKRYVPFQKTLIIVVIFLTTVLPLLPIFTHTQGFHVGLVGDYGTWLNKTYLVNLSLISTFLGGAIVFISPPLNKKIKEKRNGKSIKFQGILLTFFLLAIAALIIQFII